MEAPGIIAIGICLIDSQTMGLVFNIVCIEMEPVGGTTLAITQQNIYVGKIL